MFRKIKSALLSIGFLVLLIGLIAAGGFLVGSFHDIREFFFPETTAFVRSTRTITNGLRGLGQLVTVSAEVSKSDVYVEVNEGFLNAGYYSASHSVIAAVEAGIDFAAIEEDSVVFDDSRDIYKLTIPAPIVTSCRIEHIDQYGGSFTLLPKDWDEIRQLAQYDALLLFVDDLLEGGILYRAESETTNRVGSFVSALTGKQTQILYEARVGELELPDSCEPELPRGWQKDQNGAWSRAN